MLLVSGEKGDLTLDDIVLPEVQALQQVAHFYRENGSDYVRIGFVGEKDTVIRKVNPEHMERFRKEWNAFCDGVPLSRRVGTPLTDIPNLNQELAESYLYRNVHTAEELAALSDGTCQNLGHGTLTFRNEARKLLEKRKLQAAEDASRKISKFVAEPAPAEPDPRYASKEDVEQVKSGLDEMKQMMAQLLEATAKRGPGRPPKPKDDAE